MNTEPTTPELTQERADAMYRHITARIDVAEPSGRTKSSRSRKVFVAAAAVVAVVGLGGAVVTGVVTGQQDAGSDSTSQGISTFESAPAPGGGDSAADSGGASTNDAGGIAGTDVPDAAREIITIASARLTVEEPNRTADDLGRWAEGIGGRVENRSEYSSGDHDVTNLRLRIPSGRTSAATDRLHEAGTVDNVTVDTQDVTAQGIDLDARIEALETSVERLRTLMGKATTTADLLRAEEMLTERQGRLESLQAQRRDLSGQVAMATYEIELTTDAADDPDGRSGFLGGLRGGWNGLVSAFGAGATALGFVLPWAALLALLAGAYVGVRRVVRR